MLPTLIKVEKVASTKRCGYKKKVVNFSSLLLDDSNNSKIPRLLVLVTYSNWPEFQCSFILSVFQL